VTDPGLKIVEEGTRENLEKESLKLFALELEKKLDQRSAAQVDLDNFRG
jgi:hypothetical protein